MTAVLYVLYLVNFSVLLLNMLIAMMNSTYAKVLDNAERRWLVERANIMASFEQGESLWAMAHRRRKYARPGPRTAAGMVWPFCGPRRPNRSLRFPNGPFVNGQ